MRKIFFVLIVAALATNCSSAKRTTGTSSAKTENSSANVSDAAKTDVASANPSDTAPVANPDAVMDGSSFEKAIVIDKKKEVEGVAAEYAWLKQNYPGYSMVKQSLSNKGKKQYDVLVIKTKEGEEKTIYFDITNFFGKF